MFIEAVPNRGSPPALLLRESYRDEEGRAQKRTLANLSKLPGDVIDGLKALLKGGTVIGTGPDAMQIERSLPHGHVAAALGMLRKIALDRLILSTAKDAPSRRYCDLVVAMIVDRLIAPRSKLGFVRAVDEETVTSSLGAVLHLGEVKDREAYEALDWLLERQSRIENGLEQHGYSHDHRGDRPQIVYGLRCTRDGLPVAVEVFDGNTADPATLRSLVETLKDRFGISRLVLVGDRGMITSARIGADLKPAGLDWISCLRAPVIRQPPVSRSSDCHGRYRASRTARAAPSPLPHRAGSTPFLPRPPGRPNTARWWHPPSSPPVLACPGLPAARHASRHPDAAASPPSEAAVASCDAPSASSPGLPDQHDADAAWSPCSQRVAGLLAQMLMEMLHREPAVDIPIQTQHPLDLRHRHAAQR
jgi:hypothetical protein